MKKYILSSLLIILAGCESKSNPTVPTTNQPMPDPPAAGDYVEKPVPDSGPRPAVEPY